MAPDTVIGVSGSSMICMKPPAPDQVGRHTESYRMPARSARKRLVRTARLSGTLPASAVPIWRLCRAGFSSFRRSGSTACAPAYCPCPGPFFVRRFFAAIAFVRGGRHGQARRQPS
jgi:hypothetical protein